MSTALDFYGFLPADTRRYVPLPHQFKQQYQYHMIFGMCAVYYSMALMIAGAVGIV